jgi:hypothetical protein
MAEGELSEAQRGEVEHSGTNLADEPLILPDKTRRFLIVFIRILRKAVPIEISSIL